LRNRSERGRRSSMPVSRALSRTARQSRIDTREERCRRRTGARRLPMRQRGDDKQNAGRRKTSSQASGIRKYPENVVRARCGRKSSRFNDSASS
jgi:hypothetical protein